MNELAQALAKVILINRIFGGNAAFSERDTQKAIKLFEVKDMRILEGYSEKEQEELRNLADCSFPVSSLICKADEIVPKIYKRMCSSTTSRAQEIGLLQDIADYINGKARFPSPKKYYVHLVRSDEEGYLNILGNGDVILDSKGSSSSYKTKFTRKEALAIDSNYEPFLEEVSNDELVE